MRIPQQILVWFVCASMTKQINSALVVYDKNLKLCGSELADALDLVCESNFYIDESKMSEPVESVGSRRYKRGVSTECCTSVTGCSIKTLKSYCLSSSTYAHALYWLIYQRNVSIRKEEITEAPEVTTQSMTSTPRPFVFKSNRNELPSFFYVKTGPRPTRSSFFST